MNGKISVRTQKKLVTMVLCKERKWTCGKETVTLNFHILPFISIGFYDTDALPIQKSKRSQ